MQPQYNRYGYEVGAAERLVPAIILIGLGAMFLLDNLHILYFREMIRYWPAAVIALGIVKLVDSASAQGRVIGGVILALGAVLLARSLGFIDISYGDLWPVILIGIGVAMLFQRDWSWPTDWASNWGNRSVSANLLSESALFGGGKRKVVAQDFRGGQLSAVFGGFELDLRRAEIEGDSATLRIDALFGGAEVKIPEHWSAVVQGTGIFGGYSDETQQPSPREYPNPKHLFVKGSAVFGGVVVKN